MFQLRSLCTEVDTGTENFVTSNQHIGFELPCLISKLTCVRTETKMVICFKLIKLPTICNISRQEEDCLNTDIQTGCLICGLINYEFALLIRISPVTTCALRTKVNS